MEILKQLFWFNLIWKFDLKLYLTCLFLNSATECHVVVPLQDRVFEV